MTNRNIVSQLTPLGETPAADDYLLLVDKSTTELRSVTVANLVNLTSFGLDTDLATLALPADTTISAFMKTILDDENEATFKATVNLEIGTDILAEQTIGIGNDNLLEVNGTTLNGEVGVFTANGINGLSEAEFKSTYNMEAGTDYLAQQTIGIADDNLVEIDTLQLPIMTMLNSQLMDWKV